MFRWLRRTAKISQAISTVLPTTEVFPYEKSLDKKLEYLKSIFDKSPDIIFREFRIGVGGSIRALIVYVDGLADKEAFELSVMKPLIYEDILSNIADTDLDPLDAIFKHLILSAEVKKEADLNKVIDSFLSGEAALIIDGFEETILLGYRKWEQRGVQEPDTEKTLRGPREGFTETLRINTSLLRRRIKDKNLVLEMLKIGVRSKTDICLVYIKDIAKPEIVEEVKRRLNSFTIDAIQGSGYIEELIRDTPYSPFPLTNSTEKPERVVGKILEGRVAIIVDGTPFVITVPTLFIENFQTIDDYFGHFIFHSLLRWLRFLAFLICTLTVPLYVGLVSFHHELLPNSLAFAFAAARAGSPFPAVVEALILSFFFEILTEAGIRIPTVVGGAVNIVGALVLGDAAVKAGLVGTPMVIVIALTAISNFVIPSLLETSTFLRYFFLLLTALFGFYGLVYGIIVTVLHMCSLYSFGVPYLSPLAPFIPSQMKDTFIRAPLWKKIFRPHQLAVDKRRGEFRLDHQKDEQGENH